MGKNILFIANADNRLFQVYSGAALRNNMFIRALTEIGHVDVICFMEDDTVSNIPDCDVVFSKRMMASKVFLEGTRSLVRMTFCPSDPYSYYRLDKQKAAVVNDFVKKGDYDIIACRYVDTVAKCGLLDYKDKLVVDFDDNQANVFKFEAIATSSLKVKLSRLYASKKIGKMLGSLSDSILCSFCSNPLELPSTRTVFLHNTTILKKTATDLTEPLHPRILFVGSLNYFPNRQGIVHFVESVFPIIRSLIPLAELRIAGNGTPDFLECLNEKDGVNAVGRVDDLVSEYQDASVVIIPLYYGSGTCVKFVEAMVMNRPVVSSVVGARGFSDVCRDGIHYMLANNDEEFAAKTVELLTSVSKSVKMAQKGRELANTFFSQDKFVGIVKDSIQGIDSQST
jgi:glycosyltransferase involved in cell wall biosynthesis